MNFFVFHKMFHAEEIDSIKVLAQELSTSSNLIEGMVEKRDLPSFYQEIFIHKKHSPKPRSILIPKRTDIENCLKNLQAHFQKQNWEVHSSAYGFLKKRDIVANAKNHLKKQAIFNTDIQDFFSNIKEGMITEFLMKKGYCKNIASTLSKICTIEGSLPPAFCTSPVLVDALLLSMDMDFEKFSKENHWTYTRYVDDISLSSETKLLPTKEDVSTLLKKYGFEINKKKTKKLFRGQRNFTVTGLSIFDDTCPRISKKKKKTNSTATLFLQKIRD